MNPIPKLLYVETDEEVTDLVDRLRELPEERAVTFVVPERARALQSPMSFRLLKRYAEAYDKRINLVTADPRLQSLSLESGFGAYADLRAYDAGNGLSRAGATAPAAPLEAGSEAAPEPAAGAVAVADPPAPPNPPSTPGAPLAPAGPRATPLLSGPPHKPARLRPPRFGVRDRRPYAVAAGVGIVVAMLAAIMVLPTASITLTVAGTPLATDLQLIGSPGQPAGSPDHFATQVLTASENQTVQGTSTGQKQIDAIPAAGAVVFRNNFIAAVNFPKGIRVSTSNGVRFDTTADTGDVPQGRSSKPVPIVAESAGQSGNVAAGAITQFVDNVPPVYTVTNPAATAGGADQRVATVITQSDWDAAKQAALNQLNPKVQQDITDAAKGQHLTGDPQQTVDVKSDHAVGDETGNFNLTVTVKSTAVGFSDTAVRQLLQQALARKVPQGSELTTDQVKTTYLVADSTPDGSVTLSGHASGYTVITFSKAAIRARLKGLSASAARSFLQGLPNVLDVNVAQPIGLPWLPFFTSRIAVQIQEVTGPASS